MKEKNRLVGVLDQYFLIFIMKAKHFARLLFQQVAVDAAGAHHHDFLLQRTPLSRGQPVLLHRRFRLMVQRDKAQIGTLPRNQVIAKIKRQTYPKHGNQIPPDDIFLVDESLHISNESQTSRRVKQKPEMNQYVE